MTSDARPAAVTQRICELLAERGYTLSPCNSERITLATKRGHALGPFLPWSDFIFVVDLDAETIGDGRSLEAMHERHRAYGEGQMKVPRLLRYRVPNSITFGVSAGPVATDVVDVATKSRRETNSGEKNSVYVLDLSDGGLHSQGWEKDPLRYGGYQISEVNPSNRTFEMLRNIAEEALRPGPHAAAAPPPDRPPMDPRLL